MTSVPTTSSEASNNIVGNTVGSPRLPASARREQILDVALGVFGTAGYHGASMNDIADAAGVTKPVLYQHFASKRELYLALIDAAGERLIEAITSATRFAGDGRAQTELGFQAYFRWVAEEHDAFMLLFGGTARRDDEFSFAVRRITDDAARAIAPLIAVELAPADRETIAHGLVGLAEGASRRLVEAQTPFDPDIAARSISRLAWAGLRSLG
jgi:AcrR family transcriptional regulator